MKQNKQTHTDPQLDTPSVANEDKHINFLAEGEKTSRPGINVDIQHQEDESRKQEWKEGIAAGKSEQRDKPHFQKRDLNEQEEY